MTITCYLAYDELSVRQSDMNKVTNRFNRSVGMFLRSFGSCSKDVKWNLFNHSCASFYSIDLWADRRGVLGLVKQLAVPYHWVLKRVMDLLIWSSYHYTCFQLRFLTSDHFINLKLIFFYFWAMNRSSPCFERHKTYFFLIF